MMWAAWTPDRPKGWTFPQYPMTKPFSLAAVDFATRIGRQTTSSGIVNQMAVATECFGIESLTFCGIPTGRQGFADVLLANKWSGAIKEWFAEYASKQCIRIDPVTQQIKRARRPFLWSEMHVDADRTPEAAALMRRRKDYGFNEAFVVPIHSPIGPSAFVSVSGFRMELPADTRLSIHVMALSAFERIREIRSPDSWKPMLSPREREVLSWVADGKSAWEIGLILKISKRTVDEHVSTAARKLNASTRTHAVAIAIKDGHIF
jgi:LuxR family quorum sensing-dependent transcriptional regulator